jgi:sulfate transport system permease protein
MHRPSRLARAIVSAYLIALIGVPLFFVFQRTFAHGWAPVNAALHDPATDAAMLLTLRVVAVAVPLNAVVGVGTALWIVRHPSWLSRLVDRLIDVPLAVSPIIIGLMLELAYATNGWCGRAEAALGLRIIFSFPGIVLASVFVSLPLVARQLIPLVREVGNRAEQTAASLGAGPVRIFFTITIRSIQWALAYGVALTLARVLGEYGAVLIVSGNITGLTQTLTLNIGSNFENYDAFQGFVGASVLAATSVVILLLLGLARHRERIRHEHRD